MKYRGHNKKGHSKRDILVVTRDFVLIHRITLSKYAGDGKTKLRGFDSPGAQFTAQSIVEKLDIIPPGKSPDLLVKLILMGDFPEEFPGIKL